MTYGRQCVVRAIDVRRLASGECEVYAANGSERQCMSLRETLVAIDENTVGELWLSSMNKMEQGRAMISQF